MEFNLIKNELYFVGLTLQMKEKLFLKANGGEKYWTN